MSMCTKKLTQVLGGFSSLNGSAKLSRASLPKKDMIIRSFKKSGTSQAIDESKDSQINIAGIKDYEFGEREEEATVDDFDPFEDEDLDDYKSIGNCCYANRAQCHGRQSYYTRQRRRNGLQCYSEFHGWGADHQTL